MLKKWDDLPQYMKTEAVRPYYEFLKKKQISLLFKRVFDFVISLILFMLFFPLYIVIPIVIVIDSRGNPFFSQIRITQYGKKFKIYKFRTMVMNAEELGASVTVNNDTRITRVGKILRKYRLDEIPQIVNIILGDMSFCGTRPESPFYVKQYTAEMFATLLLPAGVTSEASIMFKDEARLLMGVENPDEFYVKNILPQKMECNLNSIRKFSFLREIQTIINTVFAVLQEERNETLVIDSSEQIDIKRMERNEKQINEIVEIHMQTFEGFFLTFLGRGFLRQLYKGFSTYDKAGIYVAVQGEKIVGFLAYSENISQFYSYIIKHQLVQFAWYSIGAVIRQPLAMARLIRAFLKPAEAKRNCEYIELSSIGVLPDKKNKQIGSRLIKALQNQYLGTQFAYIKLETDAEDNEAANFFYRKNGFVLTDTYHTREGRKMNEYRWYT